MINPYDSPTARETLNVDDRQATKTRVSRPATALIIMSSIHSVFVAINLISIGMYVTQGGNASHDWIGITSGSIHFICLICIAIGAAKLGFLESYPLAKLAAVLACIPFITPFFFLGLPFGIWALLLLSDPTVKNAFPNTTTTPSQKLI